MTGPRKSPGALDGATTGAREKPATETQYIVSEPPLQALHLDVAARRLLLDLPAIQRARAEVVLAMVREGGGLPLFELERRAEDIDLPLKEVRRSVDLLAEKGLIRIEPEAQFEPPYEIFLMVEPAESGGQRYDGRDSTRG